MAAFGPPLGYLAAPSKRRPKFVQPLGSTSGPYVTLAALARYEHVKAESGDPRFAAVIAGLEADDQARQSADFTLAGLTAKLWTLRLC
jgi:hypothetical protein